MDTAEKEMRNLLLEYGATFQRRTAGSNEVWHLPGGAVFVCGAPGKKGDLHAWRNNLARLRRMLPKTKPTEVEIKQAANAPPPIVDKAQPLWSSSTTREEFNTPRLVIAPAPAKEAPVEKKKYPFELDRWTPEQDKVLREGVEAGLAWAEIAVLVGDVRKGASKAACSQRWHDIVRKSTKEAVFDAPLRAVPPPSQSDGLVAVTFTLGATRRVLNVDKATAERMIALAVSL
jgi:hypothetical protein